MEIADTFRVSTPLDETWRVLQRLAAENGVKLPAVRE